MESRTVVVVEPGTTRTVAIAGRRHKDTGRPELLGFGSVNSAGMRKGRVSNPEYVAKGVEQVLDKIDDATGGGFRDCIIVCSCGDTSFRNVEGRVALSTREGEVGVVGEADKVRAVEACRKPETLEGRISLDAFGQGWRLDDSPETVLEPIDREARYLSRRAMVPDMPLAEIEAFEKVFSDCDVTVRHEIFSAAAALSAATTQQQREDGVLCIDFGGGTTSWCLARHSRIEDIGALPVGGDHVTNDILAAFRPGSTMAAERLKITHGHAVLEGVPRGERVPVAVDGGASARTVPLYAVAQVVNARMDETLRLVRSSLESRGATHLLGAGVVVCGGASLLGGLPELVTRVFDAPCLAPTLSSGIEGFDREPARYATIWGAFTLALEKDARENARAERRTFLGRLANWFEKEDRA